VKEFDTCITDKNGIGLALAYGFCTIETGTKCEEEAPGVEKAYEDCKTRL